MDSGGLYVMILGAYQIPMWPVDSLDILVLSVLTMTRMQGERLFSSVLGERGYLVVYSVRS